MGYYIDPPSKTKEEWLKEHGEPFFSPRWPADPGKTIVCLVFNPQFTAAAIAYKEEEFNDLHDIHDPRPMLWYQVPTEDILSVCPEVGEKL